MDKHFFGYLETLRRTSDCKYRKVYWLLALLQQSAV